MHGVVNIFCDAAHARQVCGIRDQTHCRYQIGGGRTVLMSVDSVEDVNRIVTNGLQSGGKEPSEMRDYGFMQQRTLEDFDGHTWEIFFMDISKFPTAEN
jgi:predicted lactoylglutathione lyase